MNRKQNTFSKRLGMLLILCMMLAIGSNLLTYAEDATTDIQTADDLNGQNIGMMYDASFAGDITSHFNDSTFTYYSSYADMIEDLKQGKIDAYITDRINATSQVCEVSGLKLLDDPLSITSYGFIISDEILQGELNVAIKELKEDGTLDALAEKWFSEDISSEVADRLETDLGSSSASDSNTERIVHAASGADNAPFSFRENGEIVGYDVDVLRLLAKRTGYELELVQYSQGSLLNSVASGQADLAIGGIAITDEASQTVKFTNPICESEAIAVVRSTGSTGSIWQSIKDSLHHTLIQDGRWKQIMSGIGVTTALAIITLILGTALGLAFSYLMDSRKPRLAKSIILVNTILDTIPLLILLMIFYYVIFSRSHISAFIVAAAGLTLNFSNTVASLLNTGIKSVNPWQKKAAEAMGYRPGQIFRKITLPQASQLMYEQYIGAVTTMVKDTSIVGYITVQDLTNVTDTIRSSTYQAFFPLLLTAILYFIIAKAIVTILTKVMRKMSNYRKIGKAGDDK